MKIDPKILELEIPIFGICYGLQLLAHSYGGIVEEKEKGEYGFSELSLDCSHDIFSEVPSKINAWMRHMDQVTKLPSNWNIIAQLLSLALVTLSGPAVIFLLYFKRGNL